MHFANIFVSIAMALLGYAVFVFMAENYKPFNVPAKNSSDDSNRRHYHILGLVAGCLVALSSLAAWFLKSDSFVEGLKASFILATVLLLLLLLLDWLRGFFNNRNGIENQNAHSSNDSMPQTLSDHESNDLDNAAKFSQTHNDDVESKLLENNLELQEKTKTIIALETSITDLQNDTVTLSEKANRLDASEAELQAVKSELSSLKTRDQESRILSEQAMEKLRTENLNLQHEAGQAQQLKQELESNREELLKLKSDTERNVHLNSELEQKEHELQVLRQKLEMKDIRHNDLITDLTEGKGQIRSNAPELEKLKMALASNEQTSYEQKVRLQQAALKEREGRIKMEASLKRAFTIARQAIGKLHEHEKKLIK